MADITKRLSTNTGNNFYVDSTCINCDTCRQLAPASFVEAGEYSSVYSQPMSDLERVNAYQALIACPVGSIGAVITDKPHLQQAMNSFPLQIDGEVFYNGFTSQKSFGANSYFIRHAEGNWLVDSPRYVKKLIDFFEGSGGLKYIFLSHEDDVADASRYAEHFGATRIIHRADAAAEPAAEWIVDGLDPIRAAADFRIIPVPGHTEGSIALLYNDRYLFTGDHMGWDRDTNALWLPSVYVWNEETLRRSTATLFQYAFEWVLPGHGDRVDLPAPKMREELQRVLKRRETTMPVS